MKVRLFLLLAAGLDGCHHVQAVQAGEPCPVGPRVVRSTVIATTGESGIIRGTVADAATWRPIPDALVWVAGTTREARTDSSGGFQLRVVQAEAGPALLAVLARTYEVHADTLRPPADSGLRVGIYLAYEQTCLAPVTVGAR